MKKKNLKQICFFGRIIALMFWLILLSGQTTIASSFSIESLSEDLKPIQGTVVGKSENDYIIDLGIEHGIQIGDLFFVSRTAEKVIHPETKKIIGHLDDNVGLLKVVKIKRGYSLARTMDEPKTIKKGDRINRFSDLSAAFWDYTGKGELLFYSIRSALSNIIWLDFDQAQKIKPEAPGRIRYPRPLIFFILKDNQLEVRDPNFQLIRFYTKVSETHLAGFEPNEKNDLTPTITPPFASRKQIMGRGKLTTRDPVPQNNTLSGYPSNIRGFQVLGKFQSTIIMSDIITSGQNPLIAVTDGRSVIAYNLSDKLMRSAELKRQKTGQVLDLQWWRPKESQNIFLAVTYWRHDQVSSNIYAFKDNQLSAAYVNLPYFLGAFDLDGDGSPESMMIQTFQKQGFWGQIIKSVQIKGEKLNYHSPPLPLPYGFTVGGSLIADLDLDGNSEVIFIRDRRLYIYRGNDLVYKSSKSAGGSLSEITYESLPVARLATMETGKLETAPIAVNLDDDPNLEIVAVTTKLNAISFGKTINSLESSRLAVIHSSKENITTGYLGQIIEYPIQGLGYHNGRVLIVTSEKSSITGKGGASYLLALPVGGASWNSIKPTLK